jgi:hypothetical protein
MSPESAEDSMSGRDFHLPTECDVFSGSIGTDEDSIFIKTGSGRIICLNSGNIYDRDPEVKHQKDIMSNDKLVIKKTTIIRRGD